MARKADGVLGANQEEILKKRVGAMFRFLASVYGPEGLVLKAGKLGALKGMKSKDLCQQVVALQKVVYEDPTIGACPSLDEIPSILDECQEEIAEHIARYSIEQEIEELVSRKMQEKHEEYLKEIKREILLDNSSPETEQTQEKLKNLLKLEKRSLARSALTILRPRSLKQIIGQDRAIQALLAKIASPYPQHVILYGPPGVRQDFRRTACASRSQEDAVFAFWQECTFHRDRRHHIAVGSQGNHQPAIGVGARSHLPRRQAGFRRRRRA